MRPSTRASIGSALLVGRADVERYVTARRALGTLIARERLGFLLARHCAHDASKSARSSASIATASATAIRLYGSPMAPSMVLAHT